MKSGVWIIEDKDDKKKIVVTHVNVRKSIIVLLGQLVALDIIAAIIVLAFFSSFIVPIPLEVKLRVATYNVPFFLLLAFGKIALSIFVVMEWLNEYYEIMPKVLIHKRGIIWRKEERCELLHMKFIAMHQGIFGKIFNCASLELYNWFTEKTTTMYLIHNPGRYMAILEDLLPTVSGEKEIIRERIRDEGEE